MKEIRIDYIDKQISDDIVSTVVVASNIRAAIEVLENDLGSIEDDVRGIEIISAEIVETYLLSQSNGLE